MTHKEISLNTKKKLASALKQAMKKKPFGKITVSELIKTCGINRNTFYYHFEDIYALLKQTLEYEAIGIVKNHNLITDYEEAIRFALNYVEKNDYILNCAYESIGIEELKRIFSADFREIVMSLITKAEELTGQTFDKEYEKFLCCFYVEALSGILVNLIKEGNLNNKSKIIKYISDTIKTSLVSIIKSGNPTFTGQ